MKPLEKSGGLVDFKENIIFEKEKDLALESSSKFYERIKKIYKYTDRKRLSILYRKIVNYQVKAYGSTITDNDCHYGVFTADDFKRVLGAAKSRRNNKKYIRTRNYEI